MRDDRLGSYSIVTTFAGIPVLLRLKVDVSQLALVPAATKAARQCRPELRRPPERGLAATSAACAGGPSSDRR